MSRHDKREEFKLAVKAKFEYLISDYSFMGPEISVIDLLPPIDVVGFYSPTISVEIFYGGRGRTVTTVASGTVGGSHLKADLPCLYLHSGLGPAQQMSEAGRTSHALNKSLDSQAIALRALLPTLTGPGRDELLTKCARQVFLSQIDASAVETVAARRAGRATTPLESAGRELTARCFCRTKGNKRVEA